MSSDYDAIVATITSNPSDFIRWPQRSILLLPGVARTVKYHHYPDAIKAELKAAGVTANTLSNGPAISAFFFAGGSRPTRSNGNGWSIHHIYDGLFPRGGFDSSLHAVKDGQHFTQSAGLVALHPIADAAASEFEEFAWWLRAEAFRRFAYDPDGVFSQPSMG